MLKKDELSKKIAIVLFEFMEISKLEWDETYFRLVQFSAGHMRAEWVYRVGREINLFPEELADRQAACRKLVESLILDLFDDTVENKFARPVVAVAAVSPGKNYQVNLAYGNNEMQISKLYLGLENSYFGGEVDTPDDVVEYRKELEAKGTTEIPSLVPRK